MLWLGTSSFAKLKEFIWGFKAFFHGAHELLRPPHSLPMLYSVGVDVYSFWFTSWNFCINHFTEKGVGSFCLCTLACSDQRMSLSHTGVNIFSSLLHQGEYSCLKSILKTGGACTLLYLWEVLRSLLQLLAILWLFLDVLQ